MLADATFARTKLRAGEELPVDGLETDASDEVLDVQETQSAWVSGGLVKSNHFFGMCFFLLKKNILI